MRAKPVSLLLAGLLLGAAWGADSPFKASVEKEDYVAAMKAVAAKFKGTPGVYLHLGDSITYANQNTALARSGGLPEAREFLKWSHCGEKNDKDGWWLASVDVPGNRSHTAASGVRADEYLKGGKGGLPPLADLIQKYNPHMALYMLGTNDVNAGRPVAQYIADVEKAVDALLANGTVVVLSTLPPCRGKIQQVEAFNAALRELAVKKKIPVVDLYGEMKARAGENLDVYLQKDGVHLSFEAAGGPATEENLKKSGYLLRCYLALHKGMEVRAKVFDGK